MASGELAEGRYWVGIWKDSPPLPSELKCRDFQAGDFVTLGDGQEWLMPDVSFHRTLSGARMAESRCAAAGTIQADSR